MKRKITKYIEGYNRLFNSENENFFASDFDEIIKYSKSNIIHAGNQYFIIRDLFNLISVTFQYAFMIGYETSEKTK